MSNSNKTKSGGILKRRVKTSANSSESSELESLKESNNEDLFYEKEAPDKLEEEFNESFKARQRRRSAGNILPVAAERLKLEVSTKLNISKTGRARQLSSEYCECLKPYCE